MPLIQLPNGAGYAEFEGGSYQEWNDLNWTSGSVYSDKLDCGIGMVAIAVHLPYNYSGATLSIYGGYDLDEIDPISNKDGLLDISVVSKSVSLPVEDLYGWRFLQFKASNAQNVTLDIKVRTSTF